MKIAALDDGTHSDAGRRLGEQCRTSIVDTKLRTAHRAHRAHRELSIEFKITHQTPQKLIGLDTAFDSFVPRADTQLVSVYKAAVYRSTVIIQSQKIWE